MKSHELAKALLARRDNDIRFDVYVTDDTGNYTTMYTELRDHIENGYEEPQWVPSEEVIYYDSTADFLVIRLNEVHVADLNCKDNHD
jgi:hypothetical protein